MAIDLQASSREQVLDARLPQGVRIEKAVASFQELL